MRLWRTNELYPPEQTDSIRAVLALHLHEKDLEGRVLLRRRLEQVERDTLRSRSRALDPWISKPRDGEIENLILEMSLGLKTKGENDEEAALRVSHYAEILGDTPLWAIKRACDRFERCEVRPDEVGERNALLTGVVPSTAHLYRVASAISRPVFHERILIYEVLNGIVVRGPSTDQQKAEVAAIAERSRRTLGGVSELEDAKRQLMGADVAQRTLEAAERIRLQEFENAGVEPPAGTKVSLSMMLKLGWSIVERPDGSNALLRPGRVRADDDYVPETRSEDRHERTMKSAGRAARGIVS